MTGNQFTTVIGVLLLTATAAGQDRLVVLGNVASPPRSAALVEADVAATTIGSPQEVVTGLPEHLLSSHQLVAVAGGRYIAWLAAPVPRPVDCLEYVAIFDRRLRTVRVVPNLALLCGNAKLVADRRRPRLLLLSRGIAGGAPGYIASIEADLTVRPIVVSHRLGIAFAYAAEVDQLFVTEYQGAWGVPTHVAIYSAGSGERVGGFAVPDGVSEVFGFEFAQMQVTGDGCRLYLWNGWRSTLDPDYEIRSYDVKSGLEVAAQPVNIKGILGQKRKFVLDEGRDLILTPDDEFIGGSNPSRILAFDATTLALLGGTGADAYAIMPTFQPLPGRGDAAAYVLAGGRPIGDCRVWVDAFDVTGVLRTRANLPQFANGCVAAAVILSPPAAPSDLTATVTERQVTLTWADPSDTSEFEIEAGLAPGRRDLVARVGLVTELSVDDVPPGVYYVRVRAINEIGASPVSNEVRVVVR